MDNTKIGKNKIAIITLYDNLNFGNRLQNFAVQRYFELYGFDVSTVPYYEATHHSLWQYAKHLVPLKKAVHALLYFTPFEKNRRIKIKIRKQRLEYIMSFTDQYIKNTQMIHFCHLPKDFASMFDSFITGSDQVWHCWWEYSKKAHEYFLLMFARPHQRLTFAPSFAMDEIPQKYAKTYQNGLNGFEYISVREERGAELIKEMTGKDAAVLLDPTMLIDTSEWLKILRKPSQFVDANYIFVYSLDGFQGEAREATEHLSRGTRLKIIDIMDQDSDYYIHTRPDEFLYWIHNAKLVVTDSFHACVFSILFNRPFVFFERSEHLGMGSRIDTLFSKFDLKGRRFDKLQSKFFDKSQWDELFTTHYESVPLVLETERMKAKEFCRKCFHINGLEW